MATYTTNYNLKKPASSDTVDIADINGNMDTLDSVLAGKQDTLTFDTEPTEGSTNPVTSGGVYTALKENEVRCYIDVTVSISQGTGDLQGITVTATASGATTLTGTTDAEGKVRLSGAVAGVTYAVAGAKTGYHVSTQSVIVAHLINTASLSAYRYGVLTITQTPVSGDVTITGGSYTGSNPYYLEPGTEYTVSVAQVSGYVQPSSQTTTPTYGEAVSMTFAHVAYPTVEVVQTGTTGIVSCAPSPFAVSGNVYTLLPSTSYTFSVSQVSGYTQPASQTVSYNAGTDNTITFAYQQLPTVEVTVTDPTASGGQIGRTITASDGTNTASATTNANGVAELTLPTSGTYTISSDAPSGATASTASVTADYGGSYTASIALVFGTGWTFGMSFNATTFQTDPTGCLTYTDDLAGETPIANTSTSLARASNYAQSYWCWNDDGTSANPMLDGCFYATFTLGGILHEKLNPNNLSQKIATWNNTTKEWESASGSSSIASEDTMFCIPTVYISRGASKLLLSSKSSDGTAYAHTIGNHTYEYLAIGVYLSSDDGTKCYSKSGTTAKGSQTRADFRSHSNAKSVMNGGKAMVWNFHQYALMRDLCWFAAKSFDAQMKIGQGGHSYSTRATGGCNAISPIAGNVSGQTDHMMCFIEDFWGCQYQFIDDFYGMSGVHYAGQNAVPTDDASNKTAIYTTPQSSNMSGFPTVIQTTDAGWGLGTNVAGDLSKGTCDYIYFRGTSDTTARLGRVGGYSGNVSGGDAGPASLYASSDLTVSNDNYGARLTFVFDV